MSKKNCRNCKDARYDHHGFCNRINYIKENKNVKGTNILSQTGKRNLTKLKYIVSII